MALDSQHDRTKGCVTTAISRDFRVLPNVTNIPALASSTRSDSARHPHPNARPTTAQ